MSCEPLYRRLVRGIKRKGKTMDKCGCEHTNHFNDEFGPQKGHDYRGVAAGSKSHPWVGGICDDCANGCLASYDLQTACPITGKAECAERDCELHYMSAPLKLRMETTPRVVSDSTYSGTGHGTQYYYRRTINGTPYRFTFVLMRNGERRHFVSRYNGYLAESVAAGYATLENALRFACAWTQVHAIIVSHPDDLCGKCGKCTRNACETHRLCYC